MKRLLNFVRIDGHLVRVSVRGEGTPMLLIMGLGGNIEMWDPLEQTLNEHGIQTIAYDASGTGDSPPRLVPMRVPGLARQAAKVLDALGHPTADVLGVSFGGPWRRSSPSAIRTGCTGSSSPPRCVGSAGCRVTRSPCRCCRPPCGTTPDSGHLLLMEQPERIAHRIDEFFATVEARNGMHVVA